MDVPAPSFPEQLGEKLVTTENDRDLDATLPGVKAPRPSVDSAFGAGDATVFFKKCHAILFDFPCYFLMCFLSSLFLFSFRIGKTIILKLWRL